MTTNMVYLPQTIVLCELRHEGFEDSLPTGPAESGLVSKWRPRYRDTLKSPPSETLTMKRASTISITVTTLFYLLCGGFGYALVGGYQVFSQPLFATIDRWLIQKYLDNDFVNSSHDLKVPLLPSFRVNLYRLCIRTAYVASTTIIAVVFPYFNQVLGVIGALMFGPLSIYFPVEMYLVQRNIPAWTGWWISLQMFTYMGLVVTLFALAGMANIA